MVLLLSATLALSVVGAPVLKTSQSLRATAFEQASRQPLVTTHLKDLLAHPVNLVSGAANTQQFTQQPVSPAPAPQAGDCTPKCTWQCESPQCDEVCEPVCQPPRCETRCAEIDTSSCAIECEKPSCAVMCPQRLCAKTSCGNCTATCSEAMCNLKCHKQQPCRNVCEQPDCVWNCRAPDRCQAPSCRMVCDAAKECAGQTYKELPPLEPGEKAVQSFAAPLNIATTQAEVMEVPVTEVEKLPTRDEAGRVQDQTTLVAKTRTRVMMLPVLRANISHRMMK